MDSAKASVVEKNQNIRRAFPAFVLGDSPVLNIERCYASSKFGLT
ncbi:MAG TPA: hypothetical protein VHQ94_05500 [Pyrinomonadaceae bacterium]|jgi:hypothetical protein|nr:hypothetical protein [Pyrinomonadaceae bacterium]